METTHSETQGDSAATRSFDLDAMFESAMREAAEDLPGSPVRADDATGGA